MPDPNAKLIKAVEDLTRELAETNRTLKKIEHNTSRVRIKNHPYLKDGDIDGTDSAPGSSDTDQG